MPKVTGTNLEKLQHEFMRLKTLSPRSIKEMFPTASPSAMVWQLQYRKGMVFEMTKEGRKIVAYTYKPECTGVIINGSKRLWEAAQIPK